MRVQAERERDFGAAVYAAVQRTSLDGILLVDSQARIVSYNQRFVEIWRVSAQTIASRSDARVLEAVAAQVAGRETFVARVVKDGGADCVPPPERIAVFDNDGCLCPENPLPFQLAFDPIVDGRACPGA